MTETVEQFDEAKERKTNIRLAVTIGGLSVGALVAFYISFFLIMFLKPGLLFSIMPIPDIPTNVLSNGQRVYLLSQRPDMSTVSFQEKQKPEMQHYISLLEGTKQGKPQSIPPYVTAIGGGGRILFLYQGGYRSFDGATWNETATNAIGSDPAGVLTAEGLYVLSTFDDGPRIYRINDGQATSIPVPADLADEDRDTSCLCPQMVWSGNALNLFRSGDGTITWATWNGSAWSQPITFPFQGAFRVLADDSSIYFFQRQANGPVSLTVLRNGSWTEPAALQLPGGFLDWFVFMQEGRPMLLARQFTEQALYPVGNGGLGEPVRMRGPFHPAGMLSGVAAFSLASNLVVVLVILGFSAVINRYKNRFRTVNGVRYEYASLFRRFAAHLIDTVVTLLPFGGAGYLFFRSSENAFDNPFLLMLVMLIFVLFFFLAGYLYHSLFEGLYGATPGKRLCGIVVLKTDLSPCGLGPAFLRNLLRIVDSFFYYLVAVIALAGTLKWQRLGDLAADTVVVRRTKIAR